MILALLAAVQQTYVCFGIILFEGSQTVDGFRSQTRGIFNLDGAKSVFAVNDEIDLITRFCAPKIQIIQIAAIRDPSPDVLCHQTF